MRIRLLAFATARDALGTDRLEIDVPSGSTVGDIEQLLVARAPEIERLWSRLAIAVDGRLTDPSTVLTDGVEVALLPPVSGGAPKAWVQTDPIDPSAVTELVSGAGVGAVVLFLGTVRNHHGGRSVVGITYSGYESMAGAVLEAIATELEAEHDGLSVAIVHRLGSLDVGEASVAIATASPHREIAYRANREALERLKRRAPIWKRERYADGTSVWREEEALVAEPA